MTDRYFNLDDLPTIKNLEGLHHISRQHCTDGDLQLFDGLLHAILERFSLLPKLVLKHFDTHAFYNCEAYEGISDTARQALWRELTDLLSTGLEKVLDDPLLARGSGVNLSDRPTTKGERIRQICDQLSEAIRQRGDLGGLAAQLAREGAGCDAGYDGEQLVKLVAKRRISDLVDHTHAIYRHVHHARIVADNQHHRR